MLSGSCILVFLFPFEIEPAAGVRRHSANPRKCPVIKLFYEPVVSVSNLYVYSGQLSCFSAVVPTDISFYIRREVVVLPLSERSKNFKTLGFLANDRVTNKNIIMSSFKSSRDIQKKAGGPDSCFG